MSWTLGLVTATGLLLMACEQPVPVEQGLAANGIHYETAGSGDPVVLIHGFSMDKRTWGPQLDLLLEMDRRVVRYDLRGHGQSASITGEFAGHEDLAALLDELGVERADIVGLSAGSRIAVDFALGFPDRVSKLVLAGPWVSGYASTEMPPWMGPVIEAIREGNDSLAAERFATSPLMQVPDDSAYNALVRDMVVGNAHLWSIASNPERSIEPPAIQRLSSLETPVLIVVGELDSPEIRDLADTLAARIDGSQLLSVESAGHLVNLAAPARFNEALVAFLAGSDRQR